MTMIGAGAGAGAEDVAVAGAGAQEVRRLRLPPKTKPWHIRIDRLMIKKTKKRPWI